MSLFIADDQGEPSLFEQHPNGGNVLVRRCDLYDRGCSHWLGHTEAVRRQNIVWELIVRAVGDQP